MNNKNKMSVIRVFVLLTWAFSIGQIVWEVLKHTNLLFFVIGVSVSVIAVVFFYMIDFLDTKLITITKQYQREHDALQTTVNSLSSTLNTVSQRTSQMQTTMNTYMETTYDDDFKQFDTNGSLSESRKDEPKEPKTKKSKKDATSIPAAPVNTGEGYVFPAHRLKYEETESI